MERKVQYFLENIQARSKQKLQELDVSLAAIQTDAREEGAAAAAEKVARFKEREFSEIRNISQVELDVRQTENRHKLLEQRQAWADETLAKVAVKVQHYIKGPEYPERMTELLSSALDALGRNRPVVVYLRRDDMALADRLQKSAQGVAITFSQGEFHLGGLIAVSPEAGRSADLSFDRALEAARDRFGEIAELELA